MQREIKTILLIVGIGISLILIIGINTGIIMGDEPYHYSLASHIYTSKSRPIYDPLVHTTEVAKRYYMNPILWHVGLVFLWFVRGGISQITAQFYQSLYYILLIIATYSLAKEIYNNKCGIFAALLAASMPVCIVFSILLYIDIPIAALSAVFFFLIAKRYHFWAGFSMGLMLLMKLNAIIYIPAAYVLIFIFTEGTVLKKIEKSIIFSIPMLLLFVPEVYYRYKTFGTIVIKSCQIIPTYPALMIYFMHPEDIAYNPFRIIASFGAPILICLLIYIIYRKSSPKDIYIWLPVSVYIISFCILFRHTLGARYLSPIIPLVSCVSSKGFAHLFNEEESSRLLSTSKKIKKIVGIALIVICILQAVAAAGYLYRFRRISIPMQEAYSYVKNNISRTSRLLSVNHAALSLYTGRETIWNSEASLPEIGYMFWFAKKREIVDILKRYNINYIFVEKNRVYDDDKIIRHTNEYPLSFIKRMRKYPSSFRLVFENNSTMIFKRID